jgi:precorrin-2 methylase
MYDRRNEGNASDLFSENVAAITIKSTRTIHTFLVIITPFFHKDSVIFNIISPTLSKTMNTIAVKLPVSTSEHIMSGTRKL